jgi:monoterpene epsilon-lactone hydrolase
MPSVRARAANLALRKFVKPTFERGASVASLRRLGRGFDRLFGTTPHDTRIAQVDLGRFTAERISTPSSHPGRIILYLPGGAFVLRSPAMHRALVARICREAWADALLTFYRLAPEHPYPAGLEDCVAAYQHLIADGWSPSEIVIGGDSAGGCLTLATLMAVRDRGGPMPAAAFTLSALTDLRPHRNGSRTTNQSLDPALSMDGSDRWNHYCGNGCSPDDPLVSPVLGDFTALPPLLMQASTIEILLDDTRVAAERAREAGVNCRTELFDGVPHAWQTIPQLPESQRALRSIGAFIRQHTRS